MHSFFLVDYIVLEIGMLYFRTDFKIGREKTANAETDPKLHGRSKFERKKCIFRGINYSLPTMEDSTLGQDCLLQRGIRCHQI